MYRLARRQEATWFRDAVAGEVGSDVLLREELDELMTLSSRKDVVKMVRRVRGKRAAKLVGQLQHAQLELGLACSRRGVTGEQDVEDALADHPAAARGAGPAGRGASGHAPGRSGPGRGRRSGPGRGRCAAGQAAGGAAGQAGSPAGQAVGATGTDSSPPSANP